MDAVADSIPPCGEDFGTQVPEPVEKDPPVRPRWKKEVSTYGEWIRTAPPGRLTKDERARLVDERAWEKAHPKLVAQLEATVGLVWRLRRDMTTLHAEAEHEQYRRGVQTHVRGTRVRIFARVGECLLGRTVDGHVLRIKHEWIEPVPPPPAPVLVPDEVGDEVSRAIAEDVT